MCVCWLPYGLFFRTFFKHFSLRLCRMYKSELKFSKKTRSKSKPTFFSIPHPPGQIGGTFPPWGPRRELCLTDRVEFRHKRVEVVLAIDVTPYCLLTLHCVTEVRCQDTVYAVAWTRWLLRRFRQFVWSPFAAHCYWFVLSPEIISL